jgi:hypothetical protein
MHRFVSPIHSCKSNRYTGIFGNVVKTTADVRGMFSSPVDM